MWRGKIDQACVQIASNRRNRSRPRRYDAVNIIGDSGRRCVQCIDLVYRLFRSLSSWIGICNSTDGLVKVAGRLHLVDVLDFKRFTIIRLSRSTPNSWNRQSDLETTSHPPANRLDRETQHQTPTDLRTDPL